MLKSFYDPGVRNVVGVTLLFKFLALIVIAVGAFFLHFNTANYFANFHFPPDYTPTFINRFKTWDAQHFLYLAQYGYKPRLMSDAFYPLFPLLIRWVGFLFLGHRLIAAFFLSTLFTVVAMVLLFKLVRDFYDEHLAFDSCVLLLVFPMGFFLGFAYADSLFLMLVLAFFYGWFKEKQVLVFGAALLLPWAKPVGFLLTPILFVAFFLAEYRPKWAWVLGSLMANLAGFFFYLSYMEWTTGDPLSGFAAQNGFLSGYSVNHFMHPLQWFVKNFVDLHWTWNGPLNGALSRVLFLALIPLVGLTYLKLDPLFVLYTLVLGMASALSGDLMSFPRYWLGLFPIFIALAMDLRGLRRWVWLACGLAQVAFILLYSVNEWVA